MYPNTNYAHEIKNTAICIFNLCVKKLKACLCIKKADLDWVYEFSNWPNLRQIGKIVVRSMLRKSQALP